MLRRYRDATSVLGDISAVLQRAFKSGRVPGVVLGGEGRVEQYTKQYDRMIALLAILTHACPAGQGYVGAGMGGGTSTNGSTGATGSGGSGGGLIEDSVARVIGDRHRTQLSKIEAGEEGYEDLFVFACPKFISPAVPDYTDLGSGGFTSGQDAYKLQVRHFMNEMASQQTMRKLRSYMKLYTSISVEKLGRLVLETEFESLLLSYKHKMRQIQVDRHVDADPAVEDPISTSSSPLDGKVGTVMDIHYYIKDDVIHVDEAEKQNRFENYFLSQISQCNDIIKDVEAISVAI